MIDEFNWSCVQWRQISSQKSTALPKFDPKYQHHIHLTMLSILLRKNLAPALVNYEQLRQLIALLSQASELGHVHIIKGNYTLTGRQTHTAD